MKSKPLHEHAFANRAKETLALLGHPPHIVDELIDQLMLTNHSISSIKHRIAVLLDLAAQHPSEDLTNIIHKYTNCKSTVEKLRLRYGATRACDFRLKMQNREQPENRTSVWNVNYWMSKGMTSKEAQDRVSEIQSANSRRRHTNCVDYATTNPLSMKYWLARGYDTVESEKIRQPFVNKSPRTIDQYINRYGPELGLKKFNEKISKRLSTMTERYGTTVVSSCVSKESLYVFLPLYRQLRKEGFMCKDIFWGIKGSREFVIRTVDGVNYFYDFTIKSKKIIVEYNNTFWHPHPDYQYNNPFVSLDEAVVKECAKREAAEQRGFKMIYIWNFEDKHAAIKRVFEEICNE